VLCNTSRPGHAAWMTGRMRTAFQAGSFALDLQGPLVQRVLLASRDLRREIGRLLDRALRQQDLQDAFRFRILCVSLEGRPFHQHDEFAANILLSSRANTTWRVGSNTLIKPSTQSTMRCGAS